MTENFEALGRYVAAREQAETAMRQRNITLSDVERAVRRAIDRTSSAYLGSGWDPATVQRLLATADAEHAALVRWINEANAVAEAAGKPRLLLDETFVGRSA